MSPNVISLPPMPEGASSGLEAWRTLGDATSRVLDRLATPLASAMRNPIEVKPLRLVPRCVASRVPEILPLAEDGRWRQPMPIAASAG